VPNSILAQMTAQRIADDTDSSTGTVRFVTIPSRLLNSSTQALINTYFPKIGTSAPINPANGRIIGGYQNDSAGPLDS